MSEKVLDIIRVNRRFSGELINEVLFFTPYRVIIAETSSTGFWTMMFGTVPTAIAVAKSEKSKKKTEKEYLELPVEDILKAGKNNFDVPYSEITKVELKKKWRTIRINIEIMDEEIEGKTYWGKWYAVGIPEKKKAKIEDYENILRPFFGDKLSVKK